MTAVLGCAAFVGWWLAPRGLDDAVWRLTPPSTAAGVVLLGVSILAVRPQRPGPQGRRLGLAAALLAGVIGALGAGALELGATTTLHEMSALAVVFLAGALILIHWERAGAVAHGLLLAVSLVSAGSVFAGLLTRMAGATPGTLSFLMAAPWSAALLTLGAAGLGVTAERGVLRLAIAPGRGGQAIRRLLAPAIGFLLAAAWLRVWVQVRQLLAPEIDITIGVLLASTVIGLLLWVNARALARMEADLAATEQSIADAVITVDPAGRIMRSNAAAERLTGWPQAEVLTRPVREVLPIVDETTREPIVPELEAALRGGESLMLDGRAAVVTRDGAAVAVAGQVTPIRSAEGNLRGAVVVLRDTTTEREAARALDDFTSELEEQVRARTKALAESERFNRATLDVLASHIAVLGPDGVVLAVNEAWRDFATANGVDPGQVSEGVNYLAVCDRAAADGVPSAETAATAIRGLASGTHGAVTFEYDCHSPEERRWFLCRVTGFGSGASSRVVVAHLDVTAEREAAIRLRESERRFAEFFRSAPDAVVIVDETDLIVDASDRVEATFGWSPAGLIGRPIETVLPAGFRERHRAFRALRRTMPLTHHRLPVPEEMRALRRDGVEFSAEVSLSLISAEQATLVAVAIRDVTIVRQIEEALRRSEERYRELVESTSEVFFKIKVTGHVGDRVSQLEYISPRAEDVTGRRVDEFFENYALWRSLMHPDDLPGVAGAATDALATGEPQSRTYRMKAADGGYRWIEDRITPTRDATGRVSGYLGVARDISERRRLEAQLLQSQKLETIGRLAGGIAHDFNNLLTVILGTVDLQLNNLREDDPALEDLSIVHEAAEQAAGLTRSLLAFSRQQILEPRVVSLNQLIDDLLTLLRRLISADVRIVFDEDRDLRPVLLDPQQFNQVIVNLAVNAGDAMPDGGVLTVRTWNDEGEAADADAPASATSGPRVLVSVSDTGTGMTEAVRARLFEPFFTTRPGRGTGLGLATVHGIVTQSGGSIAVETEVGTGTTFTIAFPAAPADAAETARPAADGVVPSGASTVLVVEDDARLRRLVSRFLQSGGHGVFVAADGAEALQVLAEHGQAIDVLFTDLVMPGMSGVELARRARTARPALRVLFTSGYAADVAMREEASLPGARFLAKPYSKADLFAALHDDSG